MKKKLYVPDASPDAGKDIDWSKAHRGGFQNLKPTREPISLRVPGITLSKIRTVANRQGVPYQNLINIWLAERAEAECKPV